MSAAFKLDSKGLFLRLKLKIHKELLNQGLLITLGGELLKN